MGNEYSDRIGKVDWVFVVEGFDNPTPQSEDDTMLTVRKVWVDDGLERPENVMVNLLKDGEYYSRIELNRANQWTYTWDQLDADCAWSVAEVNVPDGYDVSYETAGNITTITNTEDKLSPVSADADVSPDPVDLSVTKKWNDNGKNRPDTVKVTLYNGDNAVEAVLIGAWNSWSYTWRNLDGNGNWQVIETNVPGGYTPSYSYKNSVVTVTNTATLIQTG